MIVNNFNLECKQQMPAYLKNLTEAEEMLIAKSQLFEKVRKLGKKWSSNENYQQIKRHIIVIP